MIHDTLDRLSRYTCIPQVDAVVDYLARADVASLPDGDTRIRGEDLFVKVLRFRPKSASENYFETHKRYTDVQIVFRGVEQMQLAPRSTLLPHTEYDEPGDFQFFTATDEISSMVVREGEFVEFSPSEAHKPGCHWRDLDAPVLKLVFKIRT